MQAVSDHGEQFNDEDRLRNDDGEINESQNEQMMQDDNPEGDDQFDPVDGDAAPEQDGEEGNPEDGEMLEDQMVDENGNPIMQMTEEQFQQLQYQQQM